LKISYYQETDTLYIDLEVNSTSVESEEIADGIVVDYDEEGRVVGIEIENARERVNLSNLILNLPITLAV
jgi:uncharacterized protein YuzE